MNNQGSFSCGADRVKNLYFLVKFLMLLKVVLLFYSLCNKGATVACTAKRETSTIKNRGGGLMLLKAVLLFYSNKGATKACTAKKGNQYDKK